MKSLMFKCILLICSILPSGFAVAQQSATRIIEEGGNGPYSAIMATDNSLASHTLFYPENLGAFGEKLKMPVIVWGNGACANSPWEHVNFLNEVASHGFLVIAIGPMPAEGERTRDRSSSDGLRKAIDWAFEQNNSSNSIYFNKLDVKNVAVSGMSCGGLQALEIAPDPRVTSTVICNSGILPSPNSGMPGMPALTKDQLTKLHTPTLYMLGGESDIAYNNGMDDYARIDHVPAFVVNLDVGHGGTYQQPHGGEFARVATAWFLWQLKGDKEASALFIGEDCGLCSDPDWTIESKNLKTE